LLLRRLLLLLLCLLLLLLRLWLLLTLRRSLRDHARDPAPRWSDAVCCGHMTDESERRGEVKS